MGKKAKRRIIEGWKYTREGRRAHYFYPHPSPNVDERELSLCGLNYYTGHLDGLGLPRRRCLRCLKLLEEITARPMQTLLGRVC